VACFECSCLVFSKKTGKSAQRHSECTRRQKAVKSSGAHYNFCVSEILPEKSLRA